MCLQNPFTFPIVGERLEQLKAGDRAEWAQLIRQESPALLRYIMCLFWRRKDKATVADDALQETWLSLMRKVGPKYEPETLERCYLFQTARGAATQITRGRSYRQGHGTIDDPELDLLNMFEALAIESGLELAEAFEAILNRAEPSLTEQESTTVRLRIVGERTYDEISRTLDIPLGTVAGAYYRAINKLRKGLGDERGEGT